MLRIDKTYWMVLCLFLLGSILFSYLSNVEFIGLLSLLIFFLTGVVLSVVTMALRQMNPRNKTNIGTNPELPSLGNILLAFNILTVVYFLLFIDLNSSTTNLFEIPGQIAARRYSDALKMPAYLKILRLSLTIGSILGAIELAKKMSAPAVISIALVLFDGVMSSGKAGPLQGLLYVYFVFIGVKILYYRKAVNVGFRKILIGILLGICFLVVTQAGRIGRLDSDTAFFIAERLLNYAFAGVNAFDVWVRSHNWLESFSCGSETFGGIFDLLGIVKRDQGVFQEGIRFGNQPPTNIFTGFRHLIQDFSFGFIIFLATIFPFLNQLCISRIRSGNVYWIFVFTLIQSYIAWIFFSSLFSYNTYIISLFLCHIILSIKLRLRVRY